MRRHNLGLVMRALRDAGPSSRAALATKTGLTKVTVSSLANELLQHGLVREQDATRAEGKAGRPSRPLAIDADGGAGLGLWVDVDRLGVCLTDLDGRPRFTRVLRRDNTRGRPATVMRRLARLGEAALAHADAHGLRTVAATLSVPGLVDTHGTHLHLAPNLGWSDLPLSQQLTPVLAEHCPGLPPVRLTNEANAAAIAERAARRAAPEAGEVGDSFLFVILGVGVGAGVVQDGELLRGAHGFGGELGHTLVDPTGPRCACGNRGCLEALVGRDALLARARKRLRSDFPGCDDPDAAVEALHALVRARHRGAREVLDETVRALGIALTNYANILDPEAIVLGGYGAPLADALIPPIERMLKRTLLSARWAPCTLRPAITGAEAPLHGAGLLSLEALFDDPACVAQR